MLLSKSSLLPDPYLAVDYLRRQRYKQIQEKQERGLERQWFLLCGQAGQESLLNPQPAGLRKLVPPGDRSWADPFLWKHGDEWVIFCEEMLRGKPYGHIAAMRVSAEGQALSSPKPVLVKDHHLSYPFLFELEGALHMIPEGGGGRTIEVYQCEEFPQRWRPRATLMRNIQYVDATLLEYQAKWWLFVTIKRGLFTLSRDLFIFWADAPLSDNWKPHPANPVVRGFEPTPTRSSRPGGRRRTRNNPTRIR